MAYFERDYIEIKRENSIMKIEGVRHEAIEQPEVVKYLISCRRRNVGRAIAAFVGALLMAGIVFVCYKLLTETGGRVLPILFGVFFIAAFIWLVIAGFNLLARNKAIHPESEAQQSASVRDALDWKLKEKYELCELHDFVAVENALKGYPAPMFIGSTPPNLSADSRNRRINECALLQKYAKACAQPEAEVVRDDVKREPRPAAKPSGGAGMLLVYLDIDKLGDGAYGFAAGQAVGRAVPAAKLEGIGVFSGDSNATLFGNANEYVISLAGGGAALDAVEPILRGDAALAGLLSASGIQRVAATREPLVLDGRVQGGKLVNPGGGTSLCAAGFNRAWQ